MPARTISKIAVAALALVLVVLVWGFTPISRLANAEAAAAAMAAIAASPWRLAIVLACYLAAGLVFFPVLFLMIACAVVFGPVLGFVFSSLGLSASAALNYGIGRWLGREAVQNALGPRLEATRAALIRRGLVTTAIVRAIPMSPFAMVSLLAGASDIRFLDYFIGTVIGIMVPVAVMTVVTEQASRLLTEPSALQLVVLVGVIALWVAVAFGAQVLLERIAKGRGGG
jgi:uncharacterized membrane protein YdjX (TVP38/TMEM64 family)